MTTRVAAHGAGIVCPVVLLVDDDPQVLAALEAELTPRLEPWYRVERASSADEALRIVAASGDFAPLAAVVSDEKMPGRSGTELLTALRSAPSHRHGGRILLTGYAGLDSAKRAINEAEVDRYLEKPWDSARQLVPALAEILGRHAEASGLTQFWLAEVAGLPDPTAEAAITDRRRASWEMVTLLGMPAADLGVEEPSFLIDGDTEAPHVLVWGCMGSSRVPVATARITRKSEALIRLEAQTFAPGSRTEGVERLLVRTGVVAARESGAGRLESNLPASAVALYEALGFVVVRTDPTLDDAAHVGLDLAVSADPVASNFTARFDRERRACACVQSDCLRRDYARERRSYWCPLDAIEGRGPAWLAPPRP